MVNRRRDISTMGVKRTLKGIFPILLSHHPLCSIYHDDTYELFGRRFCMGCTVSYPTMAIIILTWVLFDPWKDIPEIIFHLDIILAASILFGSFQFLKYTRDTEGKLPKFLIKASLGISLGLGTVWIFSLPITFLARILIFILSIFLIQMFILLRIPHIRRRCSKCQYHGDWDICYGFRTLNKYHHFRNIKERKRIRNLMFDRERKKSAPYSDETLSSEPEPDLYDPPAWLYHDDTFDSPLTGRTGLEVRSIKEIPASDPQFRKRA